MGGLWGEGFLAGNSITINGGIVLARGGENGNGMEGSITVNGGKVTVIGGNAPASSDAVGRSAIDGGLTVNGGIVTATAGARDGAGDEGPAITVYPNIILGTGIKLYEGDSANPSTLAADQGECTKRYAIIK